MKQVSNYQISHPYGKAYVDWLNGKITKKEFYEIVKDDIPVWKQLDIFKDDNK